MTRVTGATESPNTARTSGRLPLIDVLRGVAILGTLATNVWLFTAPGGESVMLAGNGELGPMSAFLENPSVGTFAEGLFRTAANGKFLALLTLLFGVGLAIQFGSAAKRGTRWPGPYKWRALFLFVEGAVHFTLVFAADVLMGYALVSLLVAWLLTRSERFRDTVMWLSLAVHLAVMGLLTTALVLLPASNEGVPREWVDLYAHGSYIDQIAFRLDNVVSLRAEAIITFAMMVFMFLVGVRLFRAGAFGADPTGRRIRSRLLGWGMGLGVPLTLIASLAGPDWFLVDRYVVAPLVALGLIGLVGRLLDRVGGDGPVVTSMSALGRMAMTGYVAQNVILMVLCYGFGLGLAERMSGTGPWWVLGLWFGVSLLLLVASTLWLRRYDHGPMEALQKRALSRAR